MTILPSSLLQMARISAALLSRPLTALEFEKLVEASASDTTGRAFVKSFFETDSIVKDWAGVLGPTKAVVGRVFFGNVLGLAITPVQLSVVEEQGPGDPAELTQWLIDLLGSYPGREQVILAGRETLASRTASNLTVFATAQAEALVTSLSTALLDWTPDTATLSLGTEALKAGASAAQLAAALMGTPAGQQIYSGLDGAAFESKLLTQLLGRSPTAQELAAVRVENVSDKGLLAATLVSVLDEYNGSDRAIANSAIQLQRKTEAGLLIQQYLGKQLQPAALSTSDPAFSAGQQLTRGLADQSLSQVEQVRYLSELAKSASILNAISQELLRDLQLIKPIFRVTELSFSNDSGISSSDLNTNIAAQTVKAKLSAALASAELLQGSTDGGKTWIDLTRFVKGNELVWSSLTLADGEGSLQFRVSNKSGSGPVAEFSYRLDRVAPSQMLSNLTLDADTGTSSSDFITSIAPQTISLKLSAALGVDDRLYGSLDNGATYLDLTGQVKGTSLGWKTALPIGSNVLKFELRDLAGNVGASLSRAYTLEANAKGRAIDGYLDGATVFVDANNDGVQGAGEASTKTDAQGFFTLSGQTAGLVVQGGKDLSSGKAFEGVLKAPAGSSIVNPLTTVVSELVESGRTPGEAERLVAAAFGIEASLSGTSMLSFDPIAATLSGSASVRTAALQVAAASAQVINLAITVGSALSGAAGGESKLSTQTASAAVMNALAAKIDQAASGSGIASVKLSDPAVVGALIRGAANDLAGTVPSSVAQAVQAQAQSISTAASSVIAQTAAQIDTILKSASDPSAALAKIIQVQVAAQGVVSDQIQAAVQSGKAESLVTALSSQALSQIVASTAVQSIAGAASDAALISAAGVSGATTTLPAGPSSEAPAGNNPPQTGPLAPSSSDTTPPTLTIASNKSALKVGETATLTLTFSEAVNITNTSTFLSLPANKGTISALNGSGSSYTATYTPAGKLQESVSISVGSFADIAGNKGTASSGISIAVDTKPVSLTDVKVTRATQTLVLTFDDATMLASSLTPDNFAVTTPLGGISTANAVSSIKVAGNTVTMTLSSAFDAGSVGLTYQPSGDSTKGIFDASGNLTSKTTQGVVADGYLRGAEVWIDKLDGTAPIDTGIRSNASGQFFLPATLADGQPMPSGSIIIKGGFNVDTGVPNKVTMSTPPGSTTVNPLTTMAESLVRKDPAVAAALSGSASAEVKAQALAAAQQAAEIAGATVASALGLPATTDLTEYNPLAELAEDNTSAAALAAHKAAASIATLLSTATTGSGDSAGSSQASSLNSLVTSVENAALGGDTLDLKDSALVQAALGRVDPSAALEALTSISAATSGSGITQAQAVALDSVSPDSPSGVNVLVAGAAATSGRVNSQQPTMVVSIDTLDTDGTAAVAGDTVSITVGGVVIGTALVTADDFIDQTVSITPELLLPEGTYTIGAFVTDQSGRSSSASSSTASVTIDLTAPAAPILGFVEGDGLISAAEESDGFEISGTAEPASTVVVTLLGTEREPVNVDASGKWSYKVSAADLDAMGEGDETVSIVAIDQAGNTSEAALLTFVIDTEGPAVEVTLDQAVDNVGRTTGVLGGSDIDFNRVTGILGSSDFVTGLLGGTDPIVGGVAYKVTDDQTITLTGSLSSPLDVDEKLVIYDGGTKLGEFTPTGGATSWTYITPPLSDGDHALKAVVIDAAGNPSAPSSAVSLRIAANAPTATVAFNAPANTASVKNGASINLSGTTNAAVGSTISLLLGGAELSTATVIQGSGSDNTWTATVAGSSLVVGENSLRAAVKVGDVYGRLSANAMVRRDDTAPTASIKVADSALGNTETTKLIIRFSEPVLFASGLSSPSVTATKTENGVSASTSGLGTPSAVINNPDGSVSYEVSFNPDDGLSGSLVFALTNNYTDLAGNAGSSAQSTAISVDTAPPAAPVFSLVAGDAPGATAKVNAAELAAGTAIVGTAAGASKVELVLSGSSSVSVSQRALVDQAGNWTVQLDRGDLAPFGQGVIVLSATAIDALDNKSASTTGSLTVATNKPVIDALSLVDSVSTDAIRIKTAVPTLSVKTQIGTTIKVDWTNDGSFDGDPVSASGSPQTIEGPADADGGRNVVRVRVEDSAGNFTERTIRYEADLSAPAVSVASVPIDTTARTASLLFNEPVKVSNLIESNQFKSDVLSVSNLPTNYTASIVAMPGQSAGYSNELLLTFTGTEAPPTSGELTLNAGAVVDRAGNIAASDLTFKLTGSDSVRPTVTITRQGATVGSTSSDAILSRGEVATYVLTFLEPVRGFGREDLSFNITTPGADLGKTAGSIGPLVRVSDTQYRFTLAPIDLKEVQADLEIGTGFKDLAGNSPAAVTKLGLSIDTKPPTLSVSAGTPQKNTTTGALTVPLTFTFDSAPSDLAPSGSASSFDVASFLQRAVPSGRGTLSTLSGSGTTYTADYTAPPNAEGNLTWSFPTWSDKAGNRGSILSVPSIAYDTSLPVATLSTKFSGIASKATTSLAYTLNLSEPVSAADPAGLMTSAFSVSNGTLQSVTPVANSGGKGWNLSVTPAAGVGAGQLVVTLNASQVKDASGNLNAAASSASVAIDTLAPTATAAVNALKRLDDVEVDGTTDRNVLKLSGTLSASLGSGESLLVFDSATPNAPLGTATISGTTWDFTTGGLSNAAHTFSVVPVDSVGNRGSAGASKSVTVNAILPTAKVGIDTRNEISNSTTPTITGLVTGPANAQEKIKIYADGKLVGETSLGATNLAAGASATWSAALSTPLPQGTNTLVAVFENNIGVQGNKSLAYKLNIDSVAPTLSITDNVTGTATGPVTYTLSFSEPVKNLDLSDLSVSPSGQVKSLVPLSDSVFRVVVDPSPGFEGSMQLAVSNSGGNNNASVIQDRAGNRLSAVATSSQVVDTKPPGLNPQNPNYTLNKSTRVAVLDLDEPLVASGAAALSKLKAGLQISLDRGVTFSPLQPSDQVGLSGGDIQITFAQLPLSDGLRVRLLPGAGTDSAGNPNLGFVTPNSIDTRPPQISSINIGTPTTGVGATRPEITNQDQLTFLLQLSEAVRTRANISGLLGGTEAEIAARLSNPELVWLSGLLGGSDGLTVTGLLGLSDADLNARITGLFGADDLAVFLGTGLLGGTEARINLTPTGNNNQYQVVVSGPGIQNGNGELSLGLAQAFSVFDLAGNNLAPISLAAPALSTQRYVLDNTNPVLSTVNRGQVSAPYGGATGLIGTSDDLPSTGPNGETTLERVSFVIRFSEAVRANLGATGLLGGDGLVGGEDFIVGFLSGSSLTSTSQFSIEKVTRIPGSQTDFRVDVVGASLISGNGDLAIRPSTGAQFSIFDLAGNQISSGFAGGQVFKVDNQPPSVSSVTRDSSVSGGIVNSEFRTNADVLKFLVSFSEPVAQKTLNGKLVAEAALPGLLDPTDFVARLNGNILNTGVNVEIVPSANPSQYVVSVSGSAIQSANGAVDIVGATSFDIRDLAGNRLASFPPSAVYALDNIPPPVTSVVLTSVGSNAALRDSVQAYRVNQTSGTLTLSFTGNLADGTDPSGRFEYAVVARGSQPPSSFSSSNLSVNNQTISISNVAFDTNPDVYVRAIDAAGNATAPVIFPIAYDPNAPTVQRIAIDSSTPGVSTDGRTSSDVIKYLVTFNEQVRFDTNSPTTGLIGGSGVVGPEDFAVLFQRATGLVGVSTGADSLQSGFYGANGFLAALSGAGGEELNGGRELKVQSVVPAPGSGGLSFIVTVGGNSLVEANGRMSLDFTSGASIFDLAGNSLPTPVALPGGTNYQAVIVDNSAPSITQITRASSTTNPTNADSIDFIVRFSMAVSGASVNKEDFIAVNPTSQPKQQVNGIQVTSAVANTASGPNDYKVTVSGEGLANYNGPLAISLASNPTIATSDTVPKNLRTDLATSQIESVIVDNTAPEVLSVSRNSSNQEAGTVTAGYATSINSLRFKVVFSEMLDPTTVSDASNYKVVLSVGNTTVPVPSEKISVSTQNATDKSVVLTVDARGLTYNSQAFDQGNLQITGLALSLKDPAGNGLRNGVVGNNLVGGVPADAEKYIVDTISPVVSAVRSQAVVSTTGPNGETKVTNLSDLSFDVTVSESNAFSLGPQNLKFVFDDASANNPAPTNNIPLKVINGNGRFVVMPDDATGSGSVLGNYQGRISLAVAAPITDAAGNVAKASTTGAPSLSTDSKLASFIRDTVPPEAPDFAAGAAISSSVSRNFIYDEVNYGGNLGKSLQPPATNEVAGIAISFSGLQSGDRVWAGYNQVDLATSANSVNVSLGGVIGLISNYDATTKTIAIKKSNGTAFATDEILKIVTDFQLINVASNSAVRTVAYKYLDSIGNASSPATESISFNTSAKIEPIALTAYKAGIYITYKVTQAGINASGSSSKVADGLDVAIGFDGDAAAIGVTTHLLNIATSATQSFGHLTSDDRVTAISAFYRSPQITYTTESETNPVLGVLVGQINEPVFSINGRGQIYEDQSNNAKPYLGTLPSANSQLSALSREEFVTDVSLLTGSSLGRRVEPVQGKSIKLGSSVTAETITGSPDGDIIFALSGDDTIQAGKGADGIITGVGSKVIVQNISDSGSSFARSLVNVVTQQGVSVIPDPSRLNTTGFDVISGAGLYSLFGVEKEASAPFDRIKLPAGTYYASARPQITDMATDLASIFSLNEGEVWLVYGDYEYLGDRFKLDSSSSGASSSYTGSSLMVYRPVGSSETEALVLYGFAGTVNIGSDGAVNLVPSGEMLRGSNPSDYLWTAGPNVLVGTKQNDLIRTLGGSDTITAGSGADKIHLGGASSNSDANSYALIIQTADAAPASGLFSQQRIVPNSSAKKINTDFFDKIVWDKASGQFNQPIKFDLPDRSYSAVVTSGFSDFNNSGFNLEAGKFALKKGSYNELARTFELSDTNNAINATLFLYNAGFGTEAVVIVGTTDQSIATSGSDGVLSIPGWG